MATVIPTDYTTDDVLVQIEQTDRRPNDLGYLRAIALGIMVLAVEVQKCSGAITRAIDGVR